MFGKQIYRWLTLLAVAALIVAGCGGGGGGGAGGGGAGGGGGGGGGDDGTTTVEPNTEPSFTLTAFDRTGLEAGGSGLRSLSRMLSSGGNLQTLDGRILGVNQVTQETFEYNMSLKVDASSFDIQADIKLHFQPGPWDFYFLMMGPNGRQYAGVSTNWAIVDSSTNLNVIKFLVHPVLGNTIPDIETLRQLAEFQFNFNFDQVTSFDDPSFGIKVDDGDEHDYSINRATGFSSAFVYLEEGEYTFEIRFYDGGVLMNVPIVMTVNITKDGGSVDVNPVPLDVTLTSAPDETGATLNLVIPVAAVNAVGVGNVDALFSLEDGTSTLYEANLQLIQHGENYEAAVDITGLQAGPATWSLQLRDKRDNPSTLYAYCAQSIELAAAGNTVVCNLQVVNPAEEPGTVVVSVQSNGQPVPGAVILANGQPVGITGSGGQGTTAGELEVFLPPAPYTLTVSAPELGDPQTEEIEVVSGQVSVLNFMFISPDTTPPSVKILSPIGTVSTPTPVLSFTTGEPGAVQVYLDGSPLKDVRNGDTLGPLDDGDYVVEVRVTDAAGNSGADKAEFTVDTVEPGLTIVSPVEGGLYNADTVMLAVTATTGGVLDILVDGELYQQVKLLPPKEATLSNNKTLKEPAASGYQYKGEVGPLDDGDHEIEVRLPVVGKKETGTLSAAVSFTIDTTPPEVQILAPIGETEDHEPILHYDISESAIVRVLVDGQEIPTVDDEYMPAMADGPHTLTVEATDEAGNVGSDTEQFTIVTPPPDLAFTVTAQYFRKPTRRVDGEVQLDGKVKVRIPSNDQLEVLAGNPQRFVLYLRLGDIQCVYLGGSYSSYHGELGSEVKEYEWFRKLQSPICGFGKYHAGDVVEIGGSIYARILFGDSRYDETTVTATIDVAEGAGTTTPHHGQWGHWYEGRWHWGWHDRDKAHGWWHDHGGDDKRDEDIKTRYWDRDKKGWWGSRSHHDWHD